MNLAAIDMNLLVALEALVEERSVTRAAARVGLSQPAMSHALARLRDLLGDAVLVRTARGMVLTPRAQALAAQVRPALDQLRAALAPPGAFDPGTAKATFLLASADYVELVLAARLLRRLASEAPGVSIVVRRLSQSRPDPDLEAGRVELALGAFGDEGAGLYRSLLFRDRLVCLVRAGHPAVDGGGAARRGRTSPARSFDLERFLELDHLLVAPRGGGGGAVDVELGKRGLARRVRLTVPHFLTAPGVVAETDLVATLPERLAVAFAARAGVQVVEPPLPLPEIAVWQVWHERTHTSAPHRWLRSVVAEEAAR